MARYNVIDKLANGLTVITPVQSLAEAKELVDLANYFPIIDTSDILDERWLTVGYIHGTTHLRFDTAPLPFI